ncbi:MAG TPA: hypothetical protein VD902_11390, partial [Symbiobacteriaceae bacterium]|nr:hypothetical protein [Symbiobacteriaceae bacterium]
MALQVPKLEEKTYSDLVNEALARIRVHNPQWTNYNESDPGVTLLELFAFMTESLIYRANLIPERNRRKFLTLLGVPMQAAAAARGIVTFANDRGPLEAVTLPADLELKAGQVPFRAEEGLEVLPVEARVYYKRPLADDEKAEAEQIYARLYGPLGSTGELLYYETRELEPPVDPSQISSIDLATGTVDGSLWIALLARPSDKNLDEVRAKLSGRVLNIGVLPALTGESRTLLPGRTTGARRHAALIFEAATDQFQGETPLYERLQARTTADILVEPGVAAVTLPASIGLWAIAEPLTAGTGAYPPTLEDTKEEERLLTWIRVRRPDQESGSGLTAKLSWIGINAVTVTQRARVEAELLGKGTGEPDQSFTLINTPVIPGTVKLTVGGEMWQETDDLLAAGPEVPVKDRRLAPGQMQPRVQPSRVFTVDRESGVIRFGT